jgi:hypothetical protein
MKHTYGVAPCGDHYRVAILQEDGRPFQTLGPHYTYEAHARRVADKLNIGAVVWNNIWGMLEVSFVAAGLLGCWWIV